MATRTDHTALLERESELTSLGARLAEASEGAGSIVLVEGAAGTGKTMLLRAVREDAARAGARTLHAVGGELEREFPFGVVRQLFEPAVLGRGQAERKRLLSGAAALAGSVVGAAPGVGEHSADASFAVLHGLYWLTAALAEEEPLVLLVDDAHWADAPSLRFLDFLSRRIAELPVLAVVGLRPREPGAEHALLAALADAHGAEVLRPQPLTDEAVGTLVRAGLGEGTADEVVAGARETTGGNPLLLRELVRTLAPEGETATAASVRAAVPSSVTRSVERRLDRLRAEPLAVARALAVLGDRTEPEVLAAAVGVDELVVHEALAAMRAAELVDDDPPRFLHPLIGAAVAEQAGPGERRRLHRRVVEALRDRPGAHETLVVHLLALPALHEPWVVPVLRAAAARAMEEGAPDAAVRRLRRALEESGGDDPELRLELAEAGIRAADPEAGALLMAAAGADEPVLAARALSFLFGTGFLDDAAHLSGLQARGEEVRTQLEAAERHELADELRAQTLASLYIVPGLHDERRRLLASADERTDTATLVLLAYELSVSGTQDETRALLERIFVVRPLSRLSVVEQPAVASWALTAATSTDLPGPGAEQLPLGEATARRHGSRFATSFMTYLRAMWEVRFGSALRAETFARESLEILEAFSSDIMLQAGRGMLAEALILQGRLAEADALVAAFVDDEKLSQRLDGGNLWSVRLALRLAQGRYADAVADGRRVLAISREYGWPRYCLGFGAQNLARALALGGEREEARALAEAEAADAARRGVASLEAQALIALGHALADGAGLDAFRAAVDAGARSPSPWVRAETALELGVALRRSGRRAAAREPLSAARETANRCGANGLLERATEELTLAGGRPRRIALSGADSLTPSERRVAERAAEGLSNREIAELLFVTRKTVEFQLGAAYGKLGIRSRTQLAGALSA